ncbi:MAG: LysR substrate-binding domain-containing protein, partial [Microbacterium sp.]
RYRSNDYEVVRAFVAAGMGIALIPALAHREDDAIVATPLSTAIAGRRVVAAHRGEDDNPALVQLLSALGSAAAARVRHDPHLQGEYALPARR